MCLQCVLKEFKTVVNVCQEWISHHLAMLRELDNQPHLRESTVMIDVNACDSTIKKVKYSYGLFRRVARRNFPLKRTYKED